MKPSKRNPYDENYNFYLASDEFKAQLTLFMTKVRWRIPLSNVLLAEQADMGLRTLRYLLYSHRCSPEYYHKLLTYFKFAGALRHTEQQALDTLWVMHWCTGVKAYKKAVERSWEVLAGARCHSQGLDLRTAFLSDFAFEGVYPSYLKDLKVSLRQEIMARREEFGTSLATEQKAVNLKRETILGVEHFYPTASLTTFFKILTFYNEMATKRLPVRMRWNGVFGE